jgi:hypothetical protein
MYQADTAFPMRRAAVESNFRVQAAKAQHHPLVSSYRQHSQQQDRPISALQTSTSFAHTE